MLEAFEAELGCRAGETTEDGEVTFRAVECLGGCGWGTIVAVDGRYRLPCKPGDVPAIVEEGRRDRAPADRAGGRRGRALTRLAEYQAVGGYETLRSRGNAAPPRSPTS